ncbi:type II toxin-antitoxin system MqsA family antitoxin [Yersinia massiliensis]|jgi:putative transcriptional regulator|uniref:Transcriptional regulator n=2 Tax=Yersinia TaxID=629 RepID=A0A2R4NMJ1_9GAMM|nr:MULTISPECIES: type II toxin-antitoxin system MqsA family antitoxin [Yersinia]HEC1651297.1 type II toxin-antitoxin system MqsA family antitoxin [Yersinia enterocolitica]ATM86790.1 transcriptional regulator [Yersinia frederiksenii]AVX37342.1 transcriptional regulator [Yersinia massiliensis]MCB5318153.1 type II toxin-antitoxin system MqsA family antitoxin [Yersinia massiliensis]MDA5546216.1 type II toxin-antitoxin system MqsA family antitoxin [Yersinia massiliensis]
MKKRDLFSELVEGMEAWGEANTGKKTLKTHKVSTENTVTLTSEELRHIRETLNISQALFAHYLQAGIATYQNWEQGRAKPNKQAILLIKMVQKDPHTLHTLAELYE